MQGLINNIRKKVLRVFRLALLFIVGFSTTTAKSDGNEYSIKAMFVLNFIKYIEWPAENNGNFFRIGIIGKTEMTEALKGMTVTRNETKQIRIEEITEDSKETFKIIIISKTENNRIDEITRRFKNRGVLIISDECKSKCAAINLLNMSNKIRFEINTNQAHESGIKISSKLIELSVPVKQ